MLSLGIFKAAIVPSPQPTITASPFGVNAADKIP